MRWRALSVRLYGLDARGCHRRPRRVAPTPTPIPDPAAAATAPAAAAAAAGSSQTCYTLTVSDTTCFALLALTLAKALHGLVNLRRWAGFVSGGHVNLLFGANGGGQWGRDRWQGGQWGRDRGQATLQGQWS